MIENLFWIWNSTALTVYMMMLFVWWAEVNKIYEFHNIRIFNVRSQISTYVCPFWEEKVCISKTMFSSGLVVSLAPSGRSILQATLFVTAVDKEIVSNSDWEFKHTIKPLFKKTALGMNLKCKLKWINKEILTLDAY